MTRGGSVSLVPVNDGNVKTIMMSVGLSRNDDDEQKNNDDDDTDDNDYGVYWWR